MEQPPAIIKDKGYAWFIALGIILANLFGLGVSSYGNLPVLVHTWIDELGLTAQQAGLVSSIISLTIYIPGPVYSTMIHAVGSWKAQMAATVLLSAGFTVLAYGHQLWHIILGYSLLTGLGAAIAQISSVIAIEDYFSVHKNKVWTLMIAAYSIGVTVAPVMLGFFIQKLGYKFALLAEGGIVVVLNLLAAFLFIGRHFWVCCPPNKLNTEVEEKVDSDSQCPQSDSSNDKDLGAVDEKLSESQDTVSGVIEVQKHNSVPFKSRLRKSLQHHKEILKCPVFIVLLIHYIFISAGESIGLTYVIELSAHSGYATLTQSTFGPTLNGIASTITSTSMAVLSSHNKQPLVLSMVFAVILGGSVLSLPFATYLPVYYVLSFMFGVGISGYLSSIMFNLIALFGESVTTIHRAAYVFLSIGAGLLLGPLVIGDAIRILDSLDVAFYFAGVIGLLSVVFVFPLWIKKCLQTNRNGSDTS